MRQSKEALVTKIQVERNKSGYRLDIGTSGGYRFNIDLAKDEFRCLLEQMLAHAELAMIGDTHAALADDSESGVTDAINHPAHYNSHPSGNAIKYIWRADDKGDPIENLKKAIWYLQDEIGRLEGKTK